MALAIWLPATAHCAIASIPGLKFLACSSSASQAGNQPAPCEKGCCSVEKSQYLRENETVKVMQPDLAALIITAFLNFVPATTSESIQFVASNDPPELVNVWQFIFRTALPARTPSIAS